MIKERHAQFRVLGRGEVTDNPCLRLFTDFIL